MFPFFIDIYQSLENFSASKKDVEKTAHNSISDIAYSFYIELKNKASKLGNQSQISLKDKNSKESSVIVTNNNFKENGFPSFDMKPGFLASSKAKISKSGSKYIVVPISNKKSKPVSKTQEIGEQNYQPTKISAVPSTQIGKIQISSSEITPRQIQEKPSIVIEKARNIQENISENKDDVSTVFNDATLRVVSEKSDPRSWIHPGVKSNQLNFEQDFASFNPSPMLDKTIKERFLALFS